MKKNYFLLIQLPVILFSTLSSQAQITIGSNDMPSSGNTYVISIGQVFPGMDETLTDTNYTWDYSQLTPLSQTVDTFVSVLSTGLLNWLQFSSNSSYALKSNTPTLPLGFITVDYEYEFYKKSASSYVQTGFGARLSGFPVPVPYAPKDTIYRFPLNYNHVGTSSSAFAVSIPGLGYYGGNKTRTDIVDGWGTLITPYGTFSVLRVKSVINETDSIYLDTLGFGFPVPLLEETEYKWLGTGQGIPLLQINTTAGFVTRIAYLDSLINPLSVSSYYGSDNGDLIVYPNPSSGKVFLRFNLDVAEKVFLEVCDMTGHIVFSDSYAKNHPGINFLLLDLSDKNIGPGGYILRLTAGKKISRARLQVSKN